MRRKISTSGSKKARVLPEPVAASTATSLCEQRRGMVAACTGVAKLKPKDCSTSRVDSDREGRSSEKGTVLSELMMMFLSVCSYVEKKNMLKKEAEEEEK